MCLREYHSHHDSCQHQGQPLGMPEDAPLNDSGLNSASFLCVPDTEISMVLNAV